MYYRKNSCFVTESHGTALQWRATTARQSVFTFQRETTTTFAPTNRLVSLSLTNAGYKASGQIHWTDLQEAQGDQQLVDLMKHEVEWTPEALWRAFTQDSWLDGLTLTNSAVPIIGVLGAVINSSSYAGVNYTDESTFFGGGNNILSGGVHATFSLDPVPSLTAAILAAEQGIDAGEGTAFPDAVFMSYTDWSTLHNALQAQARTEFAESKYETGVKELIFMGVPIFRTRFLSAGTYWVLNSKFIDIRTPCPQMLNSFKREEPTPWSIILLMVFYGLYRVMVPRTQVKVTVT